MTTASVPDEASERAGWLARGELTGLAPCSYPAVVPQGPSPDWERKRTVSGTASPQKGTIPVLLGPQTKGWGQGSPCGDGWDAVFPVSFLPCGQSFVSPR